MANLNELMSSMAPEDLEKLLSGMRKPVISDPMGDASDMIPNMSDIGGSGVPQGEISTKVSDAQKQDIINKFKQSKNNFTMGESSPIDSSKEQLINEFKGRNNKGFQLGESQNLSPNKADIINKFKQEKNAFQTIGSPKNADLTNDTLKQIFKARNNPVADPSLVSANDDVILNTMNKSDAVSTYKGLNPESAYAELDQPNASARIAKLLENFKDSSKLKMLNKSDTLDNLINSVAKSKTLNNAVKVAGPVLAAADFGYETSNAIDASGKLLSPEEMPLNKRIGAGLQTLGKSAKMAAVPIGMTGVGLMPAALTALGGQAVDSIGQFVENPDMFSSLEEAPKDTSIRIPTVGPGGDYQPPMQDIIANEELPSQQEVLPEVTASAAPSAQKQSKSLSISSSSPKQISAPDHNELMAAALRQPSSEDEGFTNNTVENLREAQDRAAKNRLFATLGRAANNLTTGLAGLNSHVVAKNTTDDVFKDLIDSSDIPVKNFKDLTEKEKDDVKSRGSVQMRKFAGTMLQKAGFNPDLVSKMSYNEIEKNFPQITNIMTQKAAQDARADQARENRLDRIERAKMHYAEINAIKEAKKQEANDNIERRAAVRALNKAPKDIQTSGGLAGTQLRTNLVQAKRILNTLGIDADATKEEINRIPVEKLDKAKKLSVVESAIELNKMLTGSGVPAQKTLDKLLLKSGRNSAADIVDWLQNKQTPREQGEYLKDILKVVSNARETSKKELTKLNQGILPGLAMVKKHYPDEYDNLIKTYDLMDVDDYLNEKESNVNKKEDKSVKDYANQYFSGDYDKAERFLKNRGDIK